MGVSQEIRRILEYMSGRVEAEGYAPPVRSEAGQFDSPSEDLLQPPKKPDRSEMNFFLRAISVILPPDRLP